MPVSFVAQVVGTLTNLVFVFAASWAFFKAYDLVFGMRVAPEVEIEGLDIPEMGALAYPDFSLVPSHSGGISSASQMSTANRESAFGTAKKPQTV